VDARAVRGFLPTARAGGSQIMRRSDRLDKGVAEQTPWTFEKNQCSDGRLITDLLGLRIFEIRR
jgi:hypothetical protein